MNIVDITKYQALPINQLVKADWNYKEEDEHLTSKLVENIKRNGQIENIVVRELDTGFFEIVNGNHRYDALVILDVSEVVVFNMGKISLAQAQRVAIETNETRFLTNTAKLSTILSDIAKEFSIEQLQQTMPYTDERLKELVDMASFDWSQYDDKGNQGGGDSTVDDNSETVHITMESGDAERWRAYCKRIKEMNSGDDGQALLMAVAVMEGMTDEEIEAAMP